MFQNNSLRRRTLTRVGIGIGAAVAAMLALPGLAQAHVTVQPESVEGGDFSVVSFRVPNERDDASTTQVKVTLPTDQPIGSVQTTPVSGWKITTKTRQLDKPIEMFGEQLNTVVSEVTWTATNGGIRPGQFQDFNVSLGQLPESGRLVFNALQTYSSGEKVNWNQVSTDPAVEPEHPAPILTITPRPLGAARVGRTRVVRQARMRKPPLPPRATAVPTRLCRSSCRVPLWCFPWSPSCLRGAGAGDQHRQWGERHRAVRM